MTRGEALEFVRQHGAVLESASGPCPIFVEAVAGETIAGNWWSHPRSHEIFALTRAIRESDDVLVCRLLGGKITYVHRRLWTALIGAAERFDPGRLAWVKEVHTPAGHHEANEIPFPDWVPAAADDEASSLSLKMKPSKCSASTASFHGTLNDLAGRCPSRRLERRRG